MKRWTYTEMTDKGQYMDIENPRFAAGLAIYN